jgi:hypothetical protein
VKKVLGCQPLISDRVSVLSMVSELLKVDLMRLVDAKRPNRPFTPLKYRQIVIDPNCTIVKEDMMVGT